MYVMTTSTPEQPKNKSWFGLGEFIGGILFDLYARYKEIEQLLTVVGLTP